jgi:hypothetical protein
LTRQLRGEINLQEEFPLIIPPAPAVLPPAKPKLFIILSELFEQTVASIKQAVPDFQPHIYFGNTQKETAGIWPKIKGTLHKQHEIFNSKEVNDRLIIFSSLPTMVVRHSWNALHA